MSFYEYHVAKRYVQCEDALHLLPRYASLSGKKLLILNAAGPVYEEVNRKIREGFSHNFVNEAFMKSSPRYADYVKRSGHFDALKKDLTYEIMNISDLYVSEENIKKTALYAEEHGFDIVAGVGGGRGLDFARAMTHFIDIRVILVPTLAATNASISPLSVIYSDDGQRISEYWRMDSAPDCVLVDTSVIVKNPPEVLSAGIGDITCTYYEAICNVKAAGSGEYFSALSSEGLKLAVDIMKKQGPAAIEAVRAGQITPDFETVVSMIMHNCGPLWTICTMGLSHVMDEIFLYFEAAHRTMHGKRVGFAVLPMLKLYGFTEEEIDAYRDFACRVGIPTSLEQLGLSGISKDEWKKALAETVGKSGTLASVPFDGTEQDIVDALLDFEN